MKARSISSKEEIEDIIRKCEVCHMAMVDPDGLPYLLPMNFGYREGAVYLHSSAEGRKIDILRNNPQVCIGFSTDYLLRHQHPEVACSYSMKYRSLLMTGTVEWIEDPDEKIAAMNIIMQHYTGLDFPYNMPAIREVCVFRLLPRQVSGRAYGY
ncbi:MAG TPA: pyridoxamine 5'-phosphate oxidase family protein [Bacteroidales bacterium]|nr:pyridoxamine 5'-phosphate oxidase family protein [Bacteroidales bacterium]HSA43470.1 pyridoxamine 5'-phosphate oxidase family protein [Bacteroidales bacterium]